MYDEAVVIYSDLLFVINFSLDYLVLFIAGRVLNCASSVWRLLSASVFGGIYAFVPYLFELSVLISLPLHLLSAALICFIAFGLRDLKKFLLLVGTFIVTSALLGGLITALYSLSHSYSNGIYAELSATSFASICLLSAVITLAYGLICKRKIHTRSASVKIHINGIKIDCNMLCDSGNLVTEPFSALPVIIISHTCLPPPYCDPESELFPLPIRAIPFSTASGKSCFFGFRPDRIELLTPLKKPKRLDAFVGIDTNSSSYSGYDGIIPACIL